MFGMAKGPSVFRQTISRNLGAANTDWVLMAQPVPPGSTVNQISVNFSIVSANKINAWKWTKYTLHGAFVGFPNPNHGFGNSLANYDTLWDNYIPKDASAWLALTEFTNDSHPDSEMTSTSVEASNAGAIESGNPNDMFGEISGQIFTVEDAPEFFFARERRLDVTNGIVVDSDGDAGKFIPVDKYNGQINKNYHLSKDRFWFCLMAVGFPQLEATTGAFDVFPDTEFEWAHLAYPEISVLEGLLNVNEDATEYDNVKKMLETYYIDTDTAHDLSESDGDGPGQFICTLESTINYRRPRWEGVELNANSGQNA